MPVMDARPGHGLCRLNGRSIPAMSRGSASGTKQYPPLDVQEAKFATRTSRSLMEFTNPYAYHMHETRSQRLHQSMCSSRKLPRCKVTPGFACRARANMAGERS